MASVMLLYRLVNSTLGKGTVFWFQALGPAKGGEAKPPAEKA